MYVYTHKLKFLKKEFRFQLKLKKNAYRYLISAIESNYSQSQVATLSETRSKKEKKKKETIHLLLKKMLSDASASGFFPIKTICLFFFNLN